MKLQAESLIQEISNIEIEFEEREGGYHEEIGEYSYVRIVRINDLRFKFSIKHSNIKAIDGYNSHLSQIYNKFEESINNAVKTTKNNQRLVIELESIQKQLFKIEELYVYETETEHGPYELIEGCNINAKLILGYGKPGEFWHRYYDTMPLFKIQKKWLERANKLLKITIGDLQENQIITALSSTPQLMWKSRSDFFFILFAVLIKEGYLVGIENKTNNISKIASCLSSFIQVEKSKGDKKPFEAGTFEKYLKFSEYVTYKANGYSPKVDNDSKGYAFKKLAKELADILDGLDSKRDDGSDAS